MYLKLLESKIKQGILHLHLPKGKSYQFGDHGLEAHWHVESEAAIKRIARDWEYEMGQTYMEGLWRAGGHGLHDLLAVLRSNFKAPRRNQWYKPLLILLNQYNKISRSYSNVAHHYDTEERVFRLFLDKEMFYSCAYFKDEDTDLEAAQQAKAAHIAAKLLIRPDNKVLDIGCGWGSMAFHLAENHKAEVTGITLSREQLGVARQEAEKRKLSNVDFQMADYREHQGLYDRIVSIGMFEHVGQPYHLQFFQKVSGLLKDDGIALIHTIGRSTPTAPTNPWINKYIFPGGSIPSLSQASDAIERTGMMLTDVEVLRLHYARTLNHWQQRFQANRAEIASFMNEEFCRMWEFYLSACEVSFEFADLVVFQLQLAKQHGIVPVTRDYLYRA